MLFARFFAYFLILSHSGISEITRDQIIEAAKRYAAESDSPLTKVDFERLSHISDYQLYRLFPEGGWSEVRELAGIGRHPFDHDRLTDEQLLAEFLKVATETGKTPTWSIFDSKAKFSSSPVRRRFGGMQGTLKRLRDWLEAHQPDSPFLDDLHVKSRHEIPAPPSASIIEAGGNQVVWTKGPGPVFGQPINFRGLRHAHINEQGVVFLFGMTRAGYAAKNP